MKDQIQHVEPPFEIIERMVTMRVHLDDVVSSNAPLLVVPGSHRMGKLVQSEIEAAVLRLGIEEHIASRGDIWLYSTPILHASKSSQTGTNRRVLQIDFSADDLPQGMEWYFT